MAVVYLARDLRHDRLVALKVLRPEISAAAETASMMIADSKSRACWGASGSTCGSGLDARMKTAAVS